MTATLLAAALPDAGGVLPWAAAVAVAIAREADASRVAGGDGAVVLIEVGAERARGPTMLAADGARELECELRGAGFETAARGRLAWVRLAGGDDWLDGLVEVLAHCDRARAAIVCLPAARAREAVGDPRLGVAGVLLRAELPRQRALVALAVAELVSVGVRARIASRPPGRVAARRAVAGIDAGGELKRRAGRLARGLLGRSAARLSLGGARSGALASEAGQALPLVLGGILALIFCTMLLAAFGGAVTGTSRTQRAADLAALSAARSMRDDFGRLFEPVRLPGGAPNTAHLDKREYLDRALAAARDAGRRNGVAEPRLRIEFPDAGSFAPLRVRASVTAELNPPGGLPSLRVAAEAEAEAVPPSAGTAAQQPAVASGGGYAGPLAYRQGEGMRPDVAAAFDRMGAAAAHAGLSLLVNSAYRSDAEQAALWARHPDPRWVARPGTSLHRCATELDLGPSSAYAWLAANAERFGFTQRYAWEAWHYGYVEGPPPCSAAGQSRAATAGRGAADGSGPASLPAFVPERFREPLAAAAQRWGVSGALLAAQLLAESNFNPFAVSPAGASGIAQFMPGTAALYGLDDPFDAARAIDAQAHLMADLLRQFGSPELALAAYNAGPAAVAGCDCVPPISETQGYVARIVGLMGGAGAIAAAPALEVRLTE